MPTSQPHVQRPKHRTGLSLKSTLSLHWPCFREPEKFNTGHISTASPVKLNCLLGSEKNKTVLPHTTCTPIPCSCNYTGTFLNLFNHILASRGIIFFNYICWNSKYKVFIPTPASTPTPAALALSTQNLFFQTLRNQEQKSQWRFKRLKILVFTP